MIVVGGGYIGVEMSSVWSRLGTEITVLEFLPQILIASDREMALALQKLLEKQGIKFRFNTTAQGAEIKNGKVRLTWKSGDETGTEEVDKVLVCVGRRPVTTISAPRKPASISTPRASSRSIRKPSRPTSPASTRSATSSAGSCWRTRPRKKASPPSKSWPGHHGFVNYHACPSVVYTSPQLAQVGYSEDDAKKAGHEIKVGKFPFTANGYARATDETDGFVKVIGDAKTDRLLGVHILSTHAAELIAEATLAMEFASSVEDVARSFHPHPTLEEALKEAALATDKQAITCKTIFAPMGHRFAPM
jgi:dihydrolipoamide dehydrogenase